MRRQYEIIGAALLAALASTCALADDVVINLNGGQQTGSFQPIPQNQAMTTDDHGVPGFLRRKK